jgi:hypothetical protein
MAKTWDSESAIEWIKGSFRWSNGRIKARPGYEPTPLDLQAIQWLVDNEAYAWEGVPA